MANTTLTQFSAGQSQYKINFDYLARPYVVVTLIDSNNTTNNKVLTVGNDYRFLNPTTLEILTSQTGFDILQIHRFTDTDLLVDFRDGSVLTAKDLTTSELQAIHIAEEGRDQTSEFAELAQQASTEAQNALASIIAMSVYGYTPVGSFERGGTIDLRNQVLQYGSGMSLTHWRWEGALPKVVTAGSTPAGTGGIGQGAWVDVTDATLRGQLGKTTGAALVMTNSGNNLQVELDALEASLKALDTISNRVFYVDNYGAKGDGVITRIGTAGNVITGTNDSAAIQAAIDACEASGGGIVRFTAGKQYRLDWTVFYGSNMDIDFNNCYIIWNAPEPANEASFLLGKYYNMGDEINWVENVKIHDLAGLRCRYLGGNGIGLPKTRYVRVYNIKTDYCWLHTVDATGTQYIHMDNIHCRGASTLAHLQIDSMASQKSVSGAAPDGSWLYCAFDSSQTTSWSRPDMVLVTNCTARDSLYAGLHVHNSGARRVFIRDCWFLGNERGIHTDNDAGPINAMWIINCVVRQNNRHQLYLQATHNGLIVMGCQLGHDDRAHADDIVTMRTGTANALRRDITFAYNHFEGCVRGLAIQYYTNVIFSGNKFRSMGETLTSSGTMEVTNYGVSFYQCSHVINEGTMFYDCVIDTGCYHNSGSHHTVSGLNSQASYALLKANAITNLYVGPCFIASHADSPVNLAVQSCVRFVINGLYSFASGPTVSLALISLPSAFVQNCTLNGTDSTGKGILATDCSDLRTSTNNIRAFTTAIEAAGTTTATCFEPFFSAANMIKSGTGSITYHTFTTASK